MQYLWYQVPGQGSQGFAVTLRNQDMKLRIRLQGWKCEVHQWAASQAPSAPG